MDEQQEVKKPIPCNQKWDDMLPTDRGRICLGCGKLVSDFRESSWKNISKVHSSSPIPVCGIYSDEQLNSWGHEIYAHQSSCSKLLTISATLLALAQLSPTTLQAQTKVTQQQTQSSKQPSQNKPTVTKPTKKFISGTVVVLQSDSTKRPLQHVSVFVLQDTLHLKTTTDSVGRFVIDITNRFSKLPNTITLIASHPDFGTKSITLNKSNLKSLDITFQQVTVVGKVILGEPSVSVSSFYAAPPVQMDTLEKQTTIKKKWWQRKAKTK